MWTGNSGYDSKMCCSHAKAGKRPSENSLNSIPTPIVMELLDETERNWLNDYHQTVRVRLLPLLSDEKDRAWLERATCPL